MFGRGQLKAAKTARNSEKHEARREGYLVLLAVFRCFCLQSALPRCVIQCRHTIGSHKIVLWPEHVLLCSLRHFLAVEPQRPRRLLLAVVARACGRAAGRLRLCGVELARHAFADSAHARASGQPRRAVQQRRMARATGLRRVTGSERGRGDARRAAHRRADRRVQREMAARAGQRVLLRFAPGEKPGPPGSVPRRGRRSQLRGRSRWRACRWSTLRASLASAGSRAWCCGCWHWG